MSNVVDVVIVGAGAAGLTAGMTLQGCGRTYRILEATSVLGGRLRKLEGFADYPIDAGGEWISETRTVLDDIAGTNPNEATVVYDPPFVAWNGNSFQSETLPADGPDGDFKFARSTWFDFFNDHVAPSVNEQIVYNCAVDNISWGVSPVTVRCADGRDYIASQVIVTVPIKILQGNSIEWNPSLPESHQSAINDIQFLDGIKVFLKFSTKFYNDAFTIFTYNAPGDVLWWDNTFGQDSNDNILAYFGAGEPATELVSLTDSEIIAELLSRLDNVYNNQATTFFMEGHVQNWNTETFIQGAYTNDVSNQLATLRTCLSNRIFFAGEAVPVDGNNGFAHAAALSGRAAAESVLCITSCFSATATVQVLHPQSSDGQPNSTQMKDLRVGDLILVGDGDRQNTTYYETVYAFAHLHPTKMSDFLKIQTEDIGSGVRRDLEISRDHLVFVQGKINPVRADSIRIGDILQTPSEAEGGGVGTGTRVVRVDAIRKAGMYAPLTASGHLIVDGIKASSYASLQPLADEFVELQGGISTGISQHKLVHMSLSPFRIMCHQGIYSAATTICRHEYNEEGMPSYVSQGLRFANWANRLPFVVQILVFLIFMASMLPFWMSESLLVGTVAIGPLLVVVVVSLVVVVVMICCRLLLVVMMAGRANKQLAAENSFCGSQTRNK